ncbi:Superinfection immunity protein [Streptomyces sp. TLI_105]|nr:Superinfection immunity protein [Streptomyces sp. TLI_105]
MLVPMVLVVALLYFVPTVVAIVRSVPNRGSVIVVNVFLGWTVLGWIIALAMAARSGPPRSYT